MENLILLPSLAQRKANGFHRFVEDATVISEETTKAKKINHFIEANTMEIDLQSLKNDCVVPVFSKDNELTFLIMLSSKAYGMQHKTSLVVNKLINPKFVFLTSLRDVFQRLYTNLQTNS